MRSRPVESLAAGGRVSPATVVILGALSAFGPLSLDLYLLVCCSSTPWRRSSAASCCTTLTGAAFSSCSPWSAH